MEVIQTHWLTAHQSLTSIWGRRIDTYNLYAEFPPTLNSYYSHTSRGVYISKKGREYRKHILYVVETQANYSILEGDLTVEMHLYPPDNRTRDIDNYSKALFDALTQANFWVDDSQVKKTIFDIHEKSSKKRGVELIVYKGKKNHVLID